jgi:hypothetical protein
VNLSSNLFDNRAINKLASMQKKLLLKKLNKRRRAGMRKRKSKLSRYRRRRIQNKIIGLSHTSLEDIIKDQNVNIYEVQHKKVFS